MFKKNQRGISLLEFILGFGLIGIIAAGLIVLINKQLREIQVVSTAAKMSMLLEATEDYIEDNFGKIQEKIHNSIDFIEDPTATISGAAITIDINNDLKNNKYLRNDFDTSTSFGTTLSVGATFIEDTNSNIIQAIVLNGNSDGLPNPDQNNIAMHIRNGKGAIWFNNSKLATCSVGTSCVKGVGNQWEMKTTEKIFTDVFSDAGPIETNISAMAVSFIDAKTAYNESLYRLTVKQDSSKNTVESNINITINKEDGMDEYIHKNPDGTPIILDDGTEMKSKAQSIFFNALTNKDLDDDDVIDFAGNSLTYMHQIDSTGAQVSRNILSLQNNDFNIGDDPNDPTDDKNSHAYFSARGGIATNRTIDLENDGDVCSFDKDNVYSDFGLMAIDTSNNLLQCLSDDPEDPDVKTGKWSKVNENDIITPFSVNYNINNSNTIDNIVDLPDFPEEANFVVADLYYFINGTEATVRVKNSGYTGSQEYKTILHYNGPYIGAGSPVSGIGTLIPVKKKQMFYEKTPSVDSFIIEIKGYIR